MFDYISKEKGNEDLLNQALGNQNDWNRMHDNKYAINYYGLKYVILIVKIGTVFPWPCQGSPCYMGGHLLGDFWRSGHSSHPAHISWSARGSMAPNFNNIFLGSAQAHLVTVFCCILVTKNSPQGWPLARHSRGPWQGLTIR